MLEAPAARSLVVTLCTFNERANIQTLIPAIRQALPAADILVVDDNSPDGTADEARRLGAHDSHVKLLLRQEKAGLGAATLAGFQWAVDQGYDAVINMDADWSHPPAVLPKLAHLVNETDVAIASRYIAGGGIQGWSRLRHVMSRGVNWYSRLLLGLSIRDCSGAFRGYRVAKLRELNLRRFRSRGYAFQEEMLYRCASIGCRLEETPFVFQNRALGQSKINLKEVVRALWDIAMLGCERLRRGPHAGTNRARSQD